MKIPSWGDSIVLYFAGSLLNDDMFSAVGDDENNGLPDIEEIETGVHRVPLSKKVVNHGKPATVNEPSRISQCTDTFYNICVCHNTPPGAQGRAVGKPSRSSRDSA